MKKALVLLAIFSILLPAASMAGDFHLDQKRDYVRALQTFAQTLTEIRATSEAYTIAWYGAEYQDAATYDLTAADFTGTDLEGLTEAEVEAVITSLEALETWFGSHSANLEKLAKD